MNLTHFHRVHVSHLRTTFANKRAGDDYLSAHLAEQQRFGGLMIAEDRLVPGQQSAVRVTGEYTSARSGGRSIQGATSFLTRLTSHRASRNWRSDCTCQVGVFLMRVRITRRWYLKQWPVAHLEAGQLFTVPAKIAIYLFALGCAEPVADALA
jgi:hypothetical protein